MPLSHWPPVSVVMPVLNEERHLEEAVGRVLEATPGARELAGSLIIEASRPPE